MAEDWGDICQNYHGGVAESLEANADIAPLKSVLRARVYACIKRHTPGGIHCEAVEREEGLKHQTASARVSELLAADLIVIVGRTTTSSGSAARLYEVRSEKPPEDEFIEPVQLELTLK